MKILLAQPRGYCAGVTLAVETLQRALRLFRLPIYCFHQIVHNSGIIRRFQSQGVVFVEDLELVPEKSTVVFSAHGVAPAVRAAALRRSLNVVDATCPLVTKVHNEARAFARMGFTQILIGHPGHDETMGILGEAPENIVVIETLRDVEALQVPDPTRVAYITQTTLSVDDTHRLVVALKARFPDIVGPAKDDICYATQNRQEAVRKLSVYADLALIIGSANSSNSRRLAEVAESCGIFAYLIDGPEFINPVWLDQVSTLLLTAGASVSEAVVWETLDWLKINFAATIEEHPGKQELVQFPLPQPVRF